MADPAPAIDLEGIRGRLAELGAVVGGDPTGPVIVEGLGDVPPGREKASTSAGNASSSAAAEADDETDDEEKVPDMAALVELLLPEKRWDLTKLGPFSPEDMETLGVAMTTRATTTVTFLFLSRCGLTDLHIEVLAPFIAQSSLYLLHLGGNALTVRGLACACDAARDCPTLSMLWLKSNDFGAAGAPVIADRLLGVAGAGMGTTNADEVLDAAADEGDGPAEDSNSLTSIDVFNNGFGPQGMGILANAMISSTTVSLERLYIGSNRLGPGGAAVVGMVINRYPTLAQVSMDINGIGDEGAETIARALATNASLKKLSLHYNDIGEVGATALMAALVTNETLEALALGHLPMTEELCKVTGITVRDVSGHENYVGEAGTEALCNMLRSNTALTSIDLQHVFRCPRTGATVSDAALDAFVEAVGDSDTLVSLRTAAAVGEARVAALDVAVAATRAALSLPPGGSVVPDEWQEYARRGTSKRLYRQEIRKRTAATIKARKDIRDEIRLLKKRKQQVHSDMEDQRDPDFYDEDIHTALAAELGDIKDLLGAAKARENALKDMEASLRQNAARKQGSGGGGNATSSRAALPAVSS